ncbi:phospholipase D family protein [Variovorax ginsengisoli]|uniref:Phosphatidylserine/phosphatidylglycerophosphate/ cardiolipin synthase-like enzyme n=1 Tax=Variovorax ginsengisoli TaxID=363844 RepID=A0ABT9S298_9BURK|nr:phospholipase D family protein [Variovorax ginsengisoli]MDP9898479.1 phosphatidylserine/phosphatidylglycerophosphate/cardiolipin synthase-like enzyme [Variovorax ginsengisoli]
MLLRRSNALMLRCAALLLACLLAACAGLPPRVVDQPIRSIPPSLDNEIGRVAASLDTTHDGFSGVRPLVQASFALDARLELIRRAQVSIDLQTYLLGNDKTGRLVLRELRDAARRGVRVRLLLDDFYTGPIEPLLLALSSEPNVEVRLFNPFVNGREHSLTRWIDFFADFRRLNHRMHNKLFVADGAMAIAGGRNLADEYFLRSEGANFIDFELLMAGPVVPELESIFDIYWNSEVVYPLDRLASRLGRNDDLQDDFEHATSEELTPLPDPTPETDMFGDPPLGRQMDSGNLPWIRGVAEALADTPYKAFGRGAYAAASLAQRTQEKLAEARVEVNIVSPYFIPGEAGIARLRTARERGVRVSVVTNSLADSDEPLVNINYNRYRVELLQAGVELLEMSTTQLKRSGQMRRLLRQARGRLHAKLALIDRRQVLLGSMNLDPRSDLINTELGVRVDSFELAHALIYAYQMDHVEGVYRVRLKPDGQSVQWVGTGDVQNQVLDDEPDSSLLTRLQLLLFSWFVPTDQL